MKEFPGVGRQTVFPILLAISFCHFLNDLTQSLLPAMYPLLKTGFRLTFSQVGLITLTYQCTASLLQPLVGFVTDRRSQPYSLAVGMASTLIGIVLFSRVQAFLFLLTSAALIGMGSAVFHPESSRVARLASGGQHGLAQSIFQVGGNAGGALGPLLAALFVLPRGRESLGWFGIAALLAILILTRIGGWYARVRPKTEPSHPRLPAASEVSTPKVGRSLLVLLVLIFSKFFYLSSINSYYTFYLMNKFHVSIRNAQLHLFVFLGAVAAGTLVGGPVGDRIGRKRVIWVSILGVLPFTLLLPYVSLAWTAPLTVVIGLILSSAFAAIVVYAQELVPGRVGMISGMFFGFAFGMGGIGAAVLGRLADATSIITVYQVCAFLPLLGILAGFLPDLERERRKRRMAEEKNA
ncbi:MAG TPA: MFS transporter [Thermodesulfobacteriota bacterium]|nr:MFS transporter [Thermodesulfobacteriota bacterium]